MVSIHAPTRGATTPMNPQGEVLLFQSTHPHGVRRYYLIGIYSVIDVSIHAPTRGATAIKLDSFHNSQCFNPRTHTGCDLFVVLYILDVC